MTESCTACVTCIRTGHMWCRCPCHTITDHTDLDREEAHPDATDDQGKHGDDGSGQ